MSKVAIQGNASETGVFTIASPTSNTDRTLPLPDSAGTMMLTVTGVTTAQMPAGSVIQVVTAGYTGDSGTTNTSITATGRYIDIAPLFTTSTIVIMVSSTFYKNGGTGHFYIYRDGSVQLHDTRIGNALTFYAPTTLVAYDVPNTTSSVRYEVYFSNDSGSEIYFPPGGVDTTRLIAMEIAA